MIIRARIRRIVPAAVLATVAGAELHAQAAPRADDAGLLSPARIAALPAAERGAWERYVETSRRQMERDRASLAAEVRAAGITDPLAAPSAPDFRLTEEMTPAWFAGEEARRMADVILSYQTPSGGWSKHVALASPRRPGQSYAEGGRWHYVGTFDNGATTEHLRFLAAADRGRGYQRYRRGFLRGVEYILRAQFPSGCWPQVYPLEGGYHDAATFNDDAIVRVIRLLRDVARGEPAFVPAETRARADQAARRGIACILQNQLIVDQRRTGWGQQYDPLAPRTMVPARSFEPAALASRESAAVLDLLMELDGSDSAVVAAIRGAAGWMRETMQWGYTRQPGEKPVPTPGAGPLWARFYEPGSNRAVFSNRDGVIRYDWRELADSAWGYGWFTDEPGRILQRYAEWAHAHASNRSPAPAAAPAAIVDAGHQGADSRRVDGIPVYRTIGAALAAAPADGTEAFVIRIRAGRYYEKLSVDKPNVHFVGEGRDATVLTYDVAAGHVSPGGWPYGTRGSWTLRIAAPGFRLEGMTVENGFDFMANAAKPDSDSTKLRGTQAVAVMLDEGSDRAVFRDCRLSGHQDTLFPNAGRSYFQRCEILGSVDFIFGAGRAVFEDCDIVSRDRGSATNNGYITAPSTHIAQPYGFLFVRSRLKKETPGMAPNSVTLGRPWHPSGRPDAIGSAVFIDTWMDDHVGATGWSPMNSTDAAGNRVENQPEDARFFEYGSTGPGAVASPSRRVLTPEQAAEYTVVRVLDGWDPRE